MLFSFLSGPVERMRSAHVKTVKQVNLLLKANGGVFDLPLALEFTALLLSNIAEVAKSFDPDLYREGILAAERYCQVADEERLRANRKTRIDERREDLDKLIKEMEEYLHTSNPETSKGKPLSDAELALLAKIRKTLGGGDEFGATKGCDCEFCRRIRSQAKVQADGAAC